MVTKKANSKGDIYLTLLKVAEAKAREDKREQRLSFLGEGKGGFGGFWPSFNFYS